MTTSTIRRLLSSELKCQVNQVRNTAALASPVFAEETKANSFDDIPSTPSIPFLGSLVNYLPFGAFYGKSSPQVRKLCKEKYGPIYKENILSFTIVNVFDPDDFETVLRADGKYPMRDAFLTLGYYNKKHNNDVQGILTSNHEEWREMRRTFQQVMMQPKSVACYFDEHSGVADDLIAKIHHLQDSNGIVDDLRSDLSKFAAESVGVICFNKRFDLIFNEDENIESQRFFDAVDSIMTTTHNEFRQPPLYRLFETESYKQFVKAQSFIKEIAMKYSSEALQRIETAKEEGRETEGMDMIPYLLSKSTLSDEQVLRVISELVFVGVDTTSHHIAYALYLLSQNPDVQDKLYEEIKTVCGLGVFSYQDIQHMTYLKAVDKEVHRLYPVAIGTVRTLSQDIQLQGYMIPAGASVALHWSFAMKDEKYFTEPESFKPERWLRDSEERKRIHPYASTPFGVGPRSCLGRRFAEQETFLAVIKVLQKYSIEYCGEELELDYGVSVAPATKMRFRFTPRQE